MSTENSGDESKISSMENNANTIPKVISDSSEAPPPISEDDLFKYIKDKDTAQTISELLSGQRIASIYINAQSGGVSFGSEAHIAHDVIGYGQFNQTLPQTEKTYAEIITGRILGGNLHKIKNVYVKPTLYGSAHQILSETNLLILYGKAHMVKWTTSLHLLLSLQTEENLEVKPDVDLNDILSLKTGDNKGYLIDTLASDSAQKINLSLLNRLSEFLRKKNSYLVITVDSRTSLAKTILNKHLVIWSELPDSTQVIKNHLDWYISDQDEKVKALELINSCEVQQFLTTHLIPGEGDRLAELMTKVVHKEIGLTESLSHFESFALKQVEEWFEDHINLEKRTFMISLAVLSGMKYQSLLNADDQLQSLINPTPNEKVLTGTNLIFSSRSQRAQESCAHFSHDFEDTEYGRYPIEILELDNPLFQPYILRHIWNEYDRLREPLVIWLKNLGFQPNFGVRSRVAAAVGDLCKYNFGYIKEEILLPWANHQDKHTRSASAFALGVPVWDGEFAPQVLGLLHHWSTLHNNWRLNWTAAAAYGGLVGLRFPDIALRDLHNIAKLEDLRLFAVINRSILNLFHAGQFEPEYFIRVLDALIAWTSNPKKKVVTQIGLYIFLDLILEEKTDVAPNTKKFPLLLRLSQDSNTYQEKILSLWRRSLATKSTRKHALSTIRQLFHIVDVSPDFYPILEQIISELVSQGEEREQNRLLFYLNRWATDSTNRSTSAEKLSINLKLELRNGE